jgi:hypothetical protein
VKLFKYYFMAQPVPSTPRAPTRATGIAVEELKAGDPRLAEFERPPEELRRRFAASCRCFAAWQGEALTGFLWFAAGQYDEDEVGCTFRLDPRDHAVWDLDVHVVPRYRLGRSFALLWEAAFAAMRAQGARWSLSRVSAFKPESIRAHQRLGARQTGWAVFLLLGSVQFTLTSRGQLKWGRLEHGPYPALDIRAPSTVAQRPGDPLESTSADPAGRPN